MIPYIFLITSLLLFRILSYNYFNPLDKDWPTRQFILGTIMFAEFAILPRLTKLEIIFENNNLQLKINLTHHPPSIRSSHEFKFGNTYYCSGCLGSSLGILISEIIIFVYFSFPTSLSATFSIFYIILGLLLITVSFSRYLIYLKPTKRLIQHAALFIGISVTIIGCDLYFQSAFLMIVLLPIWLLFILIRIFLAQLDHKDALASLDF